MKPGHETSWRVLSGGNRCGHACNARRLSRLTADGSPEVATRCVRPDFAEQGQRPRDVEHDEVEPEG
jgi:hypothetical protein